VTRRVLSFILIDLISSFMSLLISFIVIEKTFPNIKDLLFYSGYCVLFLFIFRMYIFVSRHLRVRAFFYSALSSIFASISYYFYPKTSIRVLFTSALMFFCILLFTRIMPFLIRRNNKKKRLKNILIYGAGEAGIMIAKEIIKDRSTNTEVIGFVDDDERLWGNYIEGLRVYGGREIIENTYIRYDIDEVLVALPSAHAKEIEEIRAFLKEKSVKARNLPAESELVDGSVSYKEAREFSIDDVLRKEPHPRDLVALGALIGGKKVLITGAGGSIGSELSRQVLLFNPKRLLVAGHGENSIYLLKNELKSYENFDSLLMDIQDYEKVEKVIEEFKPDIIFHAAAHKHVPLMEENPDEGVKNNIFGSFNVFEIAGKNRVSRLIFISTDKAVNPKSVMGATKRVAEKMMIAFSEKFPDTIYASVRFGNVIGSRGSVFPLFKKQIKEGGPLTLTHPEVERFFMSIPEAVQLTMEAACLGKGGEVFILDMGEPVKILDIAEKMIRLSGMEPGKDINIKITGLRDGEKLTEELFYGKEVRINTRNKKIFIAKHTKVPIEFIETVEKEFVGINMLSDDDIRKRLRSLVEE